MAGALSHDEATELALFRGVLVEAVELARSLAAVFRLEGPILALNSSNTRAALNHCSAPTSCQSMAKATRGTNMGNPQQLSQIGAMARARQFSD